MNAKYHNFRCMAYGEGVGTCFSPIPQIITCVNCITVDHRLYAKRLMPWDKITLGMKINAPWGSTFTCHVYLSIALTMYEYL